MADTVIKLGDFVFEHAEIPQSINFGGDQKLAINKFVGGKRTINAMGRDDDDVTWSGIFVGAEASARAQHLDYLRSKGDQLSFTYLNFKYSVIIKAFSASVQKYYQVPYKITLCVIEDLANPVIVPPPAGFLDALYDDIATLFDAYSLITNPPIGVALEILSSYLNTLLPNDAITATIRATLTGLIKTAASEVSKAIADLSGSL